MNATEPTAIVTVLLTDIEASTRQWERDRERMASALARHDGLARASVEANHGTVVKMTGDGLFAIFGDPVDAIKASLALQLGLADPETTGGIPLRVRCGMHVGIVERRDNDWFGTTVNRGARIMAAAHGGQMLVSQAVIELTRGRLPAGVTLRDLGSVRLRDLTSPEHVHQVVHAGLRQEFPALRSLETTPNNLPQQVSSFIGREHELREACRLLADARLLTLVGPGGIGKTRFSLQVAADVIDAFPDGVWFIELASIIDPILVPKAVAEALGVAEDGATPIAQTVCEHLASRRLLLVLDNCEHLVETCARLAETLLGAAPNIRVLASSREALEVAGEQTYTLPPLSLPDSGSGAQDTARSEAGQLFVERARLRQPGFSVSEENSRAIAQLCARLDGIPLALELAAARVGALSVDTIVERLDDRFRLLTRGSRTAVPRQQTLRALIDWSYDLLDDAEKTLFARLSVFAGGWTLDAAETVAADPGIAKEDVIELMTGLVHKSLVVPVKRGERYRMLETLRDYARDRLKDRGETAAVRARHRDYFLAFAERAEPNLEGGPEQPIWMVYLDQEHDNLRSALAGSLEAPDPTGAGLRICGALYRFWLHRGHAREGRQWCDAALASVAGNAGTPALAKALHAAGTLTWRFGDIVAARSLLEQALEHSRTQKDLEREGRILSNLGGVAIHLADTAAAHAFLERAVAIHRTLGNRTLEARVLNNLAALAISEDRIDQARAPLERAVALSRALGNRMEEATAMSHLGYLAKQRGNLEEAQTLHERSLAIAREFGVREFEIEEVRHLGEIALARGDIKTAQARFHDALATSKQIGNQHEIALCLEATASLAGRLKSHERSAFFLGAANALREEIVMPRAPGDHRLYEATVLQCADAIGQATTELAIAAGCTSPSDAAIASAFAWLEKAAIESAKIPDRW